MRFGDGPAITVHVVSLTETGALTLSRMVEAGLPRETGGVIHVYTTPALRPPLRRRMAAERLSWIESGDHGAVHLDLGAYYIHDVLDGAPSAEGANPPISTRKEPRLGKRPARLKGGSGVCAEAMILWWLIAQRRPQALPPLTQTTLAEASGVTAGLAFRVLHRLEDLGALVPHRVGKRTSSWSIDNVERILQTWVDEDREPMRVSRAYVYARHGGEMRKKLAGLSDAVDTWALGGVAAANQYAPTLTADPMPTIWIPDHDTAAAAAKAIGGEIVTEGANIVFWQVPKDPWMTFCITADPAAPHGAPQHVRSGHRPPDARVLRSRTTRLHGLMNDMLRTSPDSAAPHPLPVTSPARALHQALQDGSGRSEDVALALSEHLGITHG